MRNLVIKWHPPRRQHSNYTGWINQQTMSLSLVIVSITLDNAFNQRSIGLDCLGKTMSMRYTPLSEP